MVLYRDKKRKITVNHQNVEKTELRDRQLGMDLNLYFENISNFANSVNLSKEPEGNPLQTL
jgi:hypothetical protein